MALKNSCRVCLTSLTKRISANIFKDSSMVPIPVKIMACSSVQVYEGDGLPACICSDCISKLNVAFDFKTKCESTDASLRQSMSTDFIDITHVKCELTEFEPTFNYDGSVNHDILDTRETISPDSGSTILQSKNRHKVKKSKQTKMLKNNTKVADITHVKCELTEFEPTFNYEGSVNHDILDTRETISPDSGSTILQSKNRHKVKKSKQTKMLKNNTKDADMVPVKKENVVTNMANMLSNHVKKQKGSLCETCGRTFEQKTHLVRHMRIHSGEKPYTCAECNRSFSQASYLRRHQFTHSGLKPYTCKLCPKVFSDPSNVRKHVRAIHIGVKNIDCTECGKKFRLKIQLSNHMRTHTGERPYECVHCSKRFSNSDSHKRHVRLHTGEKPYCCNVCGSSFSDGGNFRAHMRLHTGETTFKCKICHRGYAQNSNLKSHMKTHKT